MKTKTILIFIAIIGAVALVVFVKDIELGSVIATLFGGLGALKSRLFNGSSNLEEQLDEIDELHEEKRGAWNSEKNEFESNRGVMENKLRSLEIQADTLFRKIDHLEKQKVQEINRPISDEEILRRLGGI